MSLVVRPSHPAPVPPFADVQQRRAVRHRAVPCHARRPAHHAHVPWSVPGAVDIWNGAAGMGRGPAAAALRGLLPVPRGAGKADDAGAYCLYRAGLEI
eukprot:328062-Chlamydomonas_euryale.AAC.7